MDRETIVEQALGAIEMLTVATSAVIDAEAALRQEEHGLEVLKARLLAVAYTDGVVNGKNKAARDAQEFSVLDCQEVHDAEINVEELTQIAARAKADLEQQREYARMYRALLYSLSGLGADDVS